MSDLFDARKLASRNNLPKEDRGFGTSFKTYGLRRIVIGEMLAQVSVLPAHGNIAFIEGYGDSEMLKVLQQKSDIKHGTLNLEGGLPFKPGVKRDRFGGGGVYMSGGDMVVTGDVVIGGRSFSSVSSGRGSTMMIVNGCEVDLSRAIRLVLMVPPTVNLKIDGLIGAIGITDRLDASVTFSPSHNANLAAGAIKSLVCDLSGSGEVDVREVAEDAELDISGSGRVYASSVRGAVEASISGSGSVSIDGGPTRQLKASISGSGNISHGGTVTGNARMRVSGSGNITVSRVNGEVDTSIGGMGTIRANGQVYKPRW